MKSLARIFLALSLVLPALAFAGELRGTGNLGIVVERAAGSLVIVDTTRRQAIGRVLDLGDLSHASAVFSADQRYVFVFGRDGGLTKASVVMCDQITTASYGRFKRKLGTLSPQTTALVRDRLIIHLDL